MRQSKRDKEIEREREKGKGDRDKDYVQEDVCTRKKCNII